jgi:hypothetical protein
MTEVVFESSLSATMVALIPRFARATAVVVPQPRADDYTSLRPFSLSITGDTAAMISTAAENSTKAGDLIERRMPLAPDPTPGRGDRH